MRAGHELVTSAFACEAEGPYWWCCGPGGVAWSTSSCMPGVAGIADVMSSSTERGRPLAPRRTARAQVLYSCGVCVGHACGLCKSSAGTFHP